MGAASSESWGAGRGAQGGLCQHMARRNRAKCLHNACLPRLPRPASSNGTGRPRTSQVLCMTMVLRPPRKISEVYCRGGGRVARRTLTPGGARCRPKMGSMGSGLPALVPAVYRISPTRLNWYLTQPQPWRAGARTTPGQPPTSSMARLESATYGTYLITTTWSGCSPGLQEGEELSGVCERGAGTGAGRRQAGRSSKLLETVLPEQLASHRGTPACRATTPASPVEDGVGLHHIVHHVGLGDLLGPEGLRQWSGIGWEASVVVGI